MKTNNAQNNKGVGVKSLKIILISAIIFAVSFLIFVIINGMFYKKEIDSISVSSAFVFSSQLLTDDEYKNNTEFEISSKSALKSFAQTVASGKDFAGKTVRLTNSFSCSTPKVGREIYSIGLHTEYDTYTDNATTLFRGTFDGQGHKIHKFLIKLNELDIVDDLDECYNSTTFFSPAGFFAGLGDGAILKNLSISDFEFQCAIQQSDIVAIGGLVGYIPYKANVTIENCSVSDFKIIKTGTIDCYSYVGGLIGFQDSDQSSVLVNNCYVGEFAFDITDWSYMCYAGGLVGRFRPKKNSSIKMENCIFNKTNSNITLGNKQKYWHDICNIMQYGWEQQYTSTSSIPSTCYCSTSGGFSGLSTSNIGGATGSTMWYYESEYCNSNNDGFPLLRTFVNWKTLTFNVNDANLGQIAIAGGNSGSSLTIDIPSNYTYNLPNNTSASQSLSILSRTIVANVQESMSSAVDFKGWGQDGNTFTANFEYKPVEVLIKVVDENKQASSNATYNVSCTLNDNEYTPNNNKYTQGVIIELSDIIVTDSSYYLKRVYYQLSGSNDEIEISSSNGKYVYEVSNQATIYIEVKLKTYGLVLN